MFFNKCIKMVGENNIFIKIPGLFRTEYMFVGEKKDSALDFEGRFIKSCELFETGNLKYKNLLEKDDEPDFSIFVISCWNDQTKEVELAIDEFGRKMAFGYARYKSYVNDLWGKVIE